MNNLSRALAVTLLAATIPATIVLAQQAPGGDQAATEKSETRRGPSPETVARLQDGRVAMAKAALKLSPDQEALWAPVEAKIRAGFEERRAKREAWAAKREERRADRAEKGDGDKKGERLALPERLEKRSLRMTERAAKMTERAAKAKEFAETLKPLYASFTEEQRAVASRVLSHFGQEGRGPRGHRWAMGGGKRGHGGPERDRF
jgi:LTXXQ motif family protein